MSMYLEFFIRHGDTYLPIASFCGSSSYMEAFDGEVPSYSGLAPVDKDLLGYVQAKAEREIKNRKDYLARWEKKKQEILQASNSLEEKMEYINQEEEYMNADDDDDIEAWESVRHFVDFLYDILEEGQYAYYYEKDGKRSYGEPGSVKIVEAEPDKYLYVGIEPQMHKDVNEMTDEDKKECKLW